MKVLYRRSNLHQRLTPTHIQSLQVCRLQKIWKAFKIRRVAQIHNLEISKRLHTNITIKSGQNVSECLSNHMILYRYVKTIVLIGRAKNSFFYNKPWYTHRYVKGNSKRVNTYIDLELYIWLVIYTLNLHKLLDGLICFSFNCVYTL